MHFVRDYHPRLSDLRPLAPNERRELELEAAGGSPRITAAVTLAERKGYQANFLDAFLVSWPTTPDDVLTIPDTNDNLLTYQHFSVMMSRSRRMAKVVGVNINGRRSVRVPRGKDKWYYDGRIPLETQLGEDLYRGNLLDRGHLVRREDPNWGEEAEANTANEDTFHFTNCAPQMAAFNQKTWLSLENYILDNTRRWQDLATVFSGPVFRSDDIPYRGALIPRAFWKVVAFLSDDGKPSATAYIIDQKQELTQLEAAFGKFKTYQCSVRQIETLTELDFGALRQYDGFSNEELATGQTIRHPIESPADIVV